MVCTKSPIASTISLKPSIHTGMWRNVLERVIDTTGVAVLTVIMFISSTNSMDYGRRCIFFRASYTQLSSEDKYASTVWSIINVDCTQWYFILDTVKWFRINALQARKVIIQMGKITVKIQMPEWRQHKSYWFLLFDWQKSVSAISVLFQWHYLQTLQNIRHSSKHACV